jgi:hypothetical protein
MGYKILGYAVWQGGKLYLRRRYPDAKKKLAVAGVSTAVVVGMVAAQRANNSD